MISISKWWTYDIKRNPRQDSYRRHHDHTELMNKGTYAISIAKRRVAVSGAAIRNNILQFIPINRLIQERR